MWFKNLVIYQCQQQIQYDPEALAAELAEFSFKPCASSLAMSLGWTAPREEEGAPLVHGANGFMLLCLKIEEKIIPATVIREQVEEKVAVIEKQEQRKVGRKQRQAIRDEIYINLLPRALSKSTKVFAYFDVQSQLFIVDAPGPQKAEVVVNHLRKTLGSFKVTIPETTPPALLMTDWLRRQQLPTGFAFEDACLLKDTTEREGSVRCQRQDLLTDNIQAFLRHNYAVAQLRLLWEEQLAFVLNEDGTIKSLKFLEAVQEMADDNFSETAAQRFDASFAIMTGVLRDFIAQLQAELVKKNEKAAADATS